jgi:Carboxypeptidase regulatory-like domain
VMREEHEDDEIDEVLTGVDGQFAFAVDVAAGQLVVEAAGYAGQRRRFDSASRVVDFRLFAGATIRGRVVRGDRPCPEAELTLESFTAIDQGRPPGSYRRHATADRDGAFAFDGVPSGAQRITARGVGCVTEVGTDLDVPLGAHLDDVRVEAQVGYRLRGIAVRRGTQIGVAGVELSLDHTQPTPVTTDRDGRFTFDGVARGRYGFEIRGAAVAQDPDARIDVDGDRDDLRVEVELGRTIRGRVEPPRTASIVVPKDPNGVSVWDAETESLPDGTFELRNVPVGNQVLQAYTKDGYQKDVALSGDGDLAGLVVPLATRGDATLVAHVVDEDGQPVPFARFQIIFAFTPGQPMHTQFREIAADGSGALVVANVVADAALSVVPVDHALKDRDFVELVPGGRGHEIVVRRRPSRVIRGLVRDANGAAIAGVRVVGYPARGGTVRDAISDPAGRFELTELFEVDYELRAETVGRDASARVTVKGSELAILVLAPVYQVELRVTANGVRVPDFSCSCVYGDQIHSGSGPAVLHRARIESLQRAPITCRVETETGSAVASGTFGTTAVLELAIVAGARLTGRLVDATGKPLRDGVLYRDHHGFAHYSACDAQGRFELLHILPGRGELRALDEQDVLAAITVTGDRDLGTFTPRGTSRTP